MLERFCGFGMAQCATGEGACPSSKKDIQNILKKAQEEGKRIVLRGAGRSYGDAAIAEGAIVLSLNGLNEIISWDPQTGVIEAQAGTTLKQIWKRCLPDGYWPPVVSGTMHVTLAGALAMNIHGKNNLTTGCFGEHILEVEAVLVSGETICIGPSDELFTLLIGSAGLLGIITRVKMQLKKVASGDLVVREQICRNWQEQFERFENSEEEYLVGWVDLFARGESSGRGLVHTASHLHEHDKNSLSLEHQELPSRFFGLLPRSIMWRLTRLFLNRRGMRLINSLKFASATRKGDTQYHQSLVGFSFLLDYLPDWQKAYLPGSIVQFQCFIPKHAARNTFLKLTQMQQETHLEAYLGVLKRHRPNSFLFSWGVDGYSLALDFKQTRANEKQLRQLLKQMTDVVLCSGGRFYFAKDGSLNASDVRRYLGEDELLRFQTYKQRLDPEGILTSALAERLQLATHPTKPVE